jgi:hypothetical protein
VKYHESREPKQKKESFGKMGKSPLYHTAFSVAVVSPHPSSTSHVDEGGRRKDEEKKTFLHGF